MKYVAALFFVALIGCSCATRQAADSADCDALKVWDGVDWTDTSTVLYEPLMESKLLDFILLLPPADTTARQNTVERLIGNAAQTPGAVGLIMEIAERYLYETDTDMHDEETFRHFLISAINRQDVDEADKLRYRYLLNDVNRNRPGTVAPDFAVKRRDMQPASLHELVGQSDFTVVAFYDPECHVCSETMAAIDSSPVILDLISQGRLRLIGIYADGDEELWLAHPDKVSAPWADAIAVDDIQSDGLYSIPTTPTLYLLDRSATVRLKSPTLPLLLSTLSTQ